MRKREPKREVLAVPRLLTVSEVAAQLSVHRATVYDYIRNAGLPIVRLNPHAIRIDATDLAVWVNERKEAS
ncbi:MAG TPA: helix-turn-helix domain-containing protein [Ktedonobacteraceae bacterium]|nr:helix-turn-helix domain-containing protein [Ktedonobacteraceae bacterium]